MAAVRDSRDTWLQGEDLLLDDIKTVDERARWVQYALKE